MNPRELARLIDAHLEGRLSATEADALSAALASDAAARQQFWEQTAVHGLLPEAAHLEWLGQAAPAPEPKVVPVTWWRWAVPLAAAAAFVLLAVVWRDNQSGEPGHGGIAVLSRTVGAQWANATDERTVGAALPPGTLRLKAGAALVEFYHGARVVVEGPAELRLVSAKEAFLVAGKISAHVPPQAHGFTVGSTALQVVDLGTDFGLKVAGAATEVHVFNGKVEVRGSGPTARVLTIGEAWQLAGGVGRALPADRQAFLGEPELTQRGVNEAEARLAAWREASRRWSGETLVGDRAVIPDRSVLAHYRFETRSPAERTLTNYVVGVSAESHGSIVGATWGTGRWPGKTALDFRGEGDRVRLTLAAPMAEVTLFAWVRVESLHHGLNALLAADVEQIGAVQWLVTSSGQLRLEIARDLGRTRLDWEAVNSDPFVVPERFHQWLLLATTFDGSTIRHYGNGRLIGSGASFRPPALHIDSADLGNGRGPTLRNLAASMDEFAVLGRAMSPEEIREFYEQGKP